MAHKPKPIDKKPQSNRFEEAARALGCDEDPAHFDAALKKVARHKPSAESRSKPAAEVPEKKEQK